MEWNISPEIVQIGPVILRWYSFMFMIAFLSGFFVLQFIFKNENIKGDRAEQVFIYMFFSTIIGARVGHCLFYETGYYLSNPLEIIMIWKGGLASHGAAIAIIIGLFIYSKRNPDFRFLWVIDRVVIGVALGGFFVRIGNLFNSEIIGSATDVPWAFVFTRVDMIPRHPAQLYEAIAYLLIFFFLFSYYRRKYKQLSDGLIFGLFLIFIFGVRFILEFYKANQSAFEEGLILNMGQILSIPLVAGGIWLYIRAKQNLKKN